MPILFDIEYIGRKYCCNTESFLLHRIRCSIVRIDQPDRPPLHINVANERSAGERETRWLE